MMLELRFHEEKSAPANKPAENDFFGLLRWQVAHIMDHVLVKTFIIIVVIVNAVVIGIEADYGDGSPVWEVIELTFLTIFTVELALNVYAFRDMFWEDQLNWIGVKHFLLCCPSQQCL